MYIILAFNYTLLSVEQWQQLIVSVQVVTDQDVLKTELVNICLHPVSRNVTPDE